MPGTSDISTWADAYWMYDEPKGWWAKIKWRWHKYWNRRRVLKVIEFMFEGGIISTYDNVPLGLEGELELEPYDGMVQFTEVGTIQDLEE